MKLPYPVLLVLIAAVQVGHAADGPPRLDLTGRITDPAGQPVPGATVVVLAAGPRKGSSPLCPYNYEDCGKRTASDAQGEFRLTSLDPSMNFCITALAPGYETYVNSGLLPEAGPVQVKMRARNLAKLPANRHVAGRILDDEGRPVSGAILEVEGVVRGTTTQWGGNDSTESRVMADAHGEFHLGGRKDFNAVHVTVTAPGLAGRWAVLEPGKHALLRMKRGTALKGRLLRNGQPLANVAIAASSEDRECGKYFNIPRVLTDEEGRFAFPHVPPEIRFHIFALMASLRERDAGFLQEVTTGADGAEMDLGDMSASPAYRLAGQVVMTDGKPIPPQTRLLLARASTNDTNLAILDENGRFEFTGVPSEIITLYIAVNGYRWSAKNPSLDGDTSRQLIGRVAGNLDDFKIVLEPGAPPDWNDLDHSSWEESEKRMSLPLKSAP